MSTTLACASPGGFAKRPTKPWSFGVDGRAVGSLGLARFSGVYAGGAAADLAGSSSSVLTIMRGVTMTMTVSVSLALADGGQSVSRISTNRGFSSVLGVRNGFQPLSSIVPPSGTQNDLRKESLVSLGCWMNCVKGSGWPTAPPSNTGVINDVIGNKSTWLMHVSSARRFSLT